MKRSLITFGILFSLCLSMGLFTACSTEEEQAQPQQNLVNLAAKGKIILSMQDFNAAREITRAVQTPTDTQVVDLDNGMTAEISVERGRKRKTAVTRASDILSGHFNLYALNPATNQRVGNVLHGTISSQWVVTPSHPGGISELTFTPMQVYHSCWHPAPISLCAIMMPLKMMARILRLRMVLTIL